MPSSFAHVEDTFWQKGRELLRRVAYFPLPTGVIPCAAGFKGNSGTSECKIIEQWISFRVVACYCFSLSEWSPKLCSQQLKYCRNPRIFKNEKQENPKIFSIRFFFKKDGCSWECSRCTGLAGSLSFAFVIHFSVLVNLLHK